MERRLQEATGESSLFDPAAALRRLDGDVELLNEFIEIFFEDSPGLLRELEAHIQAGNAHSVQHTAHALKGMLSNFGAEPCVELALELERAGRSGSVAGIAESRAANLRRQWNRLCDELSRFVQDQSRSGLEQYRGGDSGRSGLADTNPAGLREYPRRG